MSIGIGLGIYLYFFEIGDKKIKPLLVVPDNAAIIIESNKSSKLVQSLGDPQFMVKLLKNEEVASFYHQLITFDSLFKSNSTLGNWFESGEAIYSFHAFNNKHVGFFMAVQTKNETNGSKAMAFINKIYPGRYQLTTRKFLGEEVYDFNDFVGDYSFSIAFKSKLMLFSFDGSLVENSLIKLKQLSPDIQMNDKNHYIFNGNKDFNVYLNYSNLPTLIKSISSDETNNSFGILGNLADKGFYQVEMNDKDLVLKGASITSDKKFQFLDLLNSQAPSENKVIQYLPGNTTFNLNITYNGYAKWYPNLKEYLFSEGLYRNYENYSDSLEYIFGKGLKSKISSYLGAQSGICSVLEPGLWRDSSYIIYFELNDPLGFKSSMNDIQAQYQKKNGGDSLIISSMDSTHLIFPFYLGDYAKVLYGNLFEGFQLNAFTIKGNFVFFASNPACLNGLIRNWNSGFILQKSEMFKDFREKTIKQSNLELFINADIAPKYALEFLNDNWFGIVSRNLGSFRKIGYIGLQFGGSTDKTFASQFTIQFNTGKTDKTEKIWEIQLDTLLESNPVSVYSNTSGEQVLLAIDKKHQLYQINKSGVILWKYQIDDKLISDIHEIDIFKNGRHQYYFNTTHYLYVVDESGKALQGWPAWIPTSTEQTVVCTDINEEKDLGFFAVGKYFKLSAFNSQGRLLPVWNPLSIYPNIVSEFYPIRLSGNRQMWALNEKGKLSGFDILGKPLKPLFPDSLYNWNHISISQIDTGSISILASDSLKLYFIKYHTWKDMEMKSISLEKPIIGNPKCIRKSNKIFFDIQLANEMMVFESSGKVVYQKQELDTFKINRNWKPFSNVIKGIWYDQLSQNIQVDDGKSGKTEPFPASSTGNYLTGDLFKDQDNYFIYGASSNRLILYRIK
jgi:hypothetical protein